MWRNIFATTFIKIWQFSIYHKSSNCFADQRQNHLLLRDYQRNFLVATYLLLQQDMYINWKNTKFFIVMFFIEMPIPKTFPTVSGKFLSGNAIQDGWGKSLKFQLRYPLSFFVFINPFKIIWFSISCLFFFRFYEVVQARCNGCYG